MRLWERLNNLLIDLVDLIASRRAIRESRRKGTISLAELKQELELDE